MALAKIKDVCLYIGLTENGAECFNMKKILADNNINFKLLAYYDEAQQKSVFDALGTWGWGTDRETKKFEDFPIVHWTECYDDFSTAIYCVTSVDELNLSALIANKKLVE